MARKIIIMGRAAAGKTSIQKLIFEGYDPNKLLKNPLSPTRGIEISNHTWLDLKIGLFDTSGQELEELLNSELRQINHLNHTDAIIYVIDSIKWENNRDILGDDIEKITQILQNNKLHSHLIFFFHKIDGVSKPKHIIKGSRNLVEKINIPNTKKIFFTSISANYIYNTYSAFFDILSSFSRDTGELKNILDKYFDKSSKMMGILISKKNSILVQALSKDMKPDIMRDIYSKFSSNYMMSEEISLIGVRIQLIANVGPMITDIYKKSVAIYHPYIKNFVIVSEQDEKTIMDLMEKVIEKINKYYLKFAEKELFS